jgi:hypothetical protein
MTPPLSHQDRKESDYVPDAAKLATHERLNKSPHYAFIRSGEGNVHLGLRVDALGARSGLIMRVSYVSACSGKQIGGAWGYSKTQNQPEGSHVCPRCVKYAAKHGINLTTTLQ